MQIKNKIAIVTGASSGIGLATSKLLSEKGARVVLVSRSKDMLENISKTIPNSTVVKADISKPAEIKDMIRMVIKKYGRIDILINNAGQGYDSPIEKIDLNTYNQLFQLNVIGQLAAIQEVIPVMRKQGAGVIINISSGTAFMYLPEMAAYSSTKRAIVGISLTAREELKKDGIIVNVVYPYITLTDFDKNTIRDSKWEENNFEGARYPPDSAEFVAEKIQYAIESEEAEIFAHDWMKKMRFN